jgi:hypothetical protein
MAMLALRPAVVDFFDTVNHRAAKNCRWRTSPSRASPAWRGSRWTPSASAQGYHPGVARRTASWWITRQRRSAGGRRHLIAMGTSEQLASLEQVCQRYRK